MEIGDGEEIEDGPGSVAKERHAEGRQQAQEHPGEGLHGICADGFDGIIFGTAFIVIKTVELHKSLLSMGTV